MNRKEILYKAISTSLLSKGVSASYQFLSLPLLMSFMSEEEFGFFSLIITFIGWVTILQGGVAPSVTRVFAKKSNIKFITHVVLASEKLIIAFAFSCLLIAVLYCVAFQEELKNATAIIVLTSLSALNLYFSLGESIRLGVHQQHVNNMYLMFANIVTILLLYLVSYFEVYNMWPVGFAIVCIYLPQVFVRGVNYNLVKSKLGLTNVMRQHVIINPRIKYIVRLLVLSAVFIQISGILIKTIAAIYLGSSDIIDVGRLEVVFRTLTILGTLYPMLQAPLWPLLLDARKKRHAEWVKKIFYYLIIGFTLFGIFVFVFFVSFYREIYGVWISSIEYFSSVEIAGLALYFIAISFNQSLVVMMMGFERFHELSKWFLIEALLFTFIVVILFFYSDYVGLSGVLYIMAILRFVLGLCLVYRVGRFIWVN